jgi:hypothetical protein
VLEEEQACRTMSSLSDFSNEILSNTYNYSNSARMCLPGGCDLAVPAANIATSEICTAFQVHPNESIGWLHMHVFATAFLTKVGLAYLTNQASGLPLCVGTMTPVSHVLQWVKQTCLQKCSGQ